MKFLCEYGVRPMTVMHCQGSPARRSFIRKKDGVTGGVLGIAFFWSISHCRIFFLRSRSRDRVIVKDSIVKGYVVSGTGVPVKVKVR